MSDIFFTSDLHLQHSMILNWRTQFSSIEEHDETIIQRWNAVVKKTDRVYLLGDVALGQRATAIEKIKRLNGQIYLIVGNHDHIAQHRECRDLFVWQKDYARLKIGDQKIYLMHYPILSWNCIHYGSYHVCAHGHRNPPDWPDCRRLDAGVDGHDLYPWPWEEIDQLLRTKPYPADHHD